MAAVSSGALLLLFASSVVTFAIIATESPVIAVGYLLNSFSIVTIVIFAFSSGTTGLLCWAISTVAVIFAVYIEVFTLKVGNAVNLVILNFVPVKFL